MTASWRLFIAHPLPADVGASLWTQLGPYRQRHATVRWLVPGSWHLTLLFLGSVPVEHVPALIALVDDVASAIGPFEVSIAAGGGRVRDGDGVAWLRVATGAGQVVALADRLAASCPPEVSTGGPPRRTPAAHLTVVRRADEGLVADLRGETLGPLRASWAVAQVDLVRSHLDSGGARYETVHEARLYAAGT